MKVFKKILLLLLISVLVVGGIACDNPAPEGPSGSGGNNSPGSHSHSYFYQRFDEYHKLVCTCGDTLKMEAHTWGDNYFQNCGTYKSCTLCGFQHQVTAPNHTNKYVPEFLNDNSGAIISFSTLEKCSKCGTVSKAHYGLPDLPINTTVVGEPFIQGETGEQHFAVKLSMTRDEAYGGRTLYRNFTKTYVAPLLDVYNPEFPGEMQDTIINNRNVKRTVNRLEYVSTILPYDVYRKDYTFNSIYLKTPFEVFLLTTTQANTFYERFFNFIRFVSTLADENEEGVLLSFEFDTSFIYQANGFVIRAKVTVDDAGDTTARTIEELCSTPPGDGIFSYCDVFEMMLGTKFQMKYLTEENNLTTLKAGDYVYCDINIGVPSADGSDVSAWSTLLAKNELGISLQMYNY